MNRAIFSLSQAARWRAVLICCGLTLAVGTGCLRDPRSHLDHARRLAYEKRYTAALAEYEEVLSIAAKKQPTQVRSLLLPALLGAGDLCHLELGETTKAIDYYRELLALFPDSNEALPARSSLANIYRSLGEKRSAVAQLVALVQSFPSDKEADSFQYQIAKDYFDLRDYDQAIIEAKMLQERYRQSVFADDSQMLIASALLQLGRNEQAAEAFAAVARGWPESEAVPSALCEEARIIAELGQEERAVTILIEALATHPNPQSVQGQISRLRQRIALRRTAKLASSAAAFPEWHGPASETRPLASTVSPTRSEVVSDGPAPK